MSDGNSLSAPSGADHHEHPPHLAHHFDTPRQQFESGKLGMWTFLATEILMFGGLFCAYAVYRSNHPDIFVYAHQYLDKILGGINTIVLICSSLTMAWAVRTAQLNKTKLTALLLALTILGGVGFMCIKYVEYKAKWEHGLLPGKHYNPTHEGGHGDEEHTDGHDAAATMPAEHDAALADTQATQAANDVPANDHAEGHAVDTETDAEATPEGEAATADAAPSGEEKSLIPPAAVGPAGVAEHVLQPAPVEASHGHIEDEPANTRVFFAVYFMMTGLHGVHVLVGMGLITWILVRTLKGHFSSEYFLPVDLVGLYWHLVDLIWIFLFPLLYLIH